MRAKDQGGMTEEGAWILAVDDERMMRELVAASLMRAGYQCRTAGSADEALNVLAQGGIRLVLADVWMLEKSGVDLLMDIQASYPEVGVIMVTAADDVQIAAEAMSLGAYDYMTKPYTIHDLALRVERALERQRLVAENRGYQRTLEALVAERTAVLERRMEEIERQIQGHLAQGPGQPGRGSA